MDDDKEITCLICGQAFRKGGELQMFAHAFTLHGRELVLSAAKSPAGRSVLEWLHALGGRLADRLKNHV